MDFPLSPSPASTVLFAGAIALVTLLIGAMFTWFAFTASSLTVSVDDGELRVRVPFYGRSIPVTSLDAASAQIVNLTESTDLRLRTRTNGIGLPGYAVGWFRLGNGEKALAAVTTRHQVLYIRTTLGYSLLLSLADPDRFLEQIAK